MNKEKIMRNERERKIPISIRIPEAASKFMKEKNYSPTGILTEALRDLGWKD